MDYKYYKTETPTNTNVSFRLLGESDVTLSRMRYGVLTPYDWNYACFSPITYSAIPPETRKILIYRFLNQIPYDLVAIKRWIDDLNTLGFPCSYHISTNDKNLIHFVVDLKDYKKKILVICALMLIRCLFEQHICYIPNFYFDLLDKNPKSDKFKSLQDAHKTNADNEFNYMNTNHTITDKSNKFNITRETFLNRVKDSRFGVYDNNDHDCNINGLWYGEKPTKIENKS